MLSLWKVEIIRTRQSTPVLLLAVSFLQKMSVFLENKNEMKKQRLPTVLLNLINNPSLPDLLNLCMRLLLNLSFDSEDRIAKTSGYRISTGL